VAAKRALRDRNPPPKFANVGYGHTKKRRR